MSEVSICNMAILHTGSSATIASLTEGSQEANLCNALYTQVRDFVLRDYPWAFAGRRVALAELAATAGEASGFPYGFAYKYSYPSDCLKIHGIGEGATTVPPRIPYRVLSDGVATAIYTDLEDAEITYTMRVTDTTLFDPMFSSALAYRLAAEIAVPLSVNARIVEQCRADYYQIVSTAAAHSMNESRVDEDLDSEFITVRQ